MRIEQVVPRISREESGPSYSVPALCRALLANGADTRLHVLDPLPATPPGDFVTFYPGWRFLFRLGISPGMKRALHAAARDADIMHNHSLWMLPNIYPAAAVRGTRCRLVVSPRGTLNPLALQRSRCIKWITWWLLRQRAAVRAAHGLHATAASELDAIRAAGFRQPVAVIPNGVELPASPAPIAARTRERRHLLYLGRLHEQKDLLLLIDAWARVAERFAGWDLRMVGPDDTGHTPELRRRILERGAPRVTIDLPALGAAKTPAYHDADLFILPSPFENFGMVVAEALAHGVPAIATTGAPWGGLADERCGWWIAPGADSIEAALTAALATAPAELAAMGARGREWMRRDFSWDAIGRQMLAFYCWLIDGGDPSTAPPFVHTV